MNLDHFFLTMQPLLSGRATASAVARSLGVNAERLALYGRFCHVHRHATLEGVFSPVKARVEPARWPSLVADYFAVHPAHHWELNANGQAFAGFVRTQPDLQPWLWQLADLCWWEHAAFVAPNAPEQPHTRDRLHPTVMLRAYTHDVVDLLAADDADPPFEKPTVVLIWRSSQLQVVMQPVAGAALVVIKAVVERVGLRRAAIASGVELEHLERARTSLVDAGAVIPRRSRARHSPK